MENDKTSFEGLKSKIPRRLFRSLQHMIDIECTPTIEDEPDEVQKRRKEIESVIISIALSSSGSYRHLRQCFEDAENYYTNPDIKNIIATVVSFIDTLTKESHNIHSHMDREPLFTIDGFIVIGTSIEEDDDTLIFNFEMKYLNRPRMPLEALLKKIDGYDILERKGWYNKRTKDFKKGVNFKIIFDCTRRPAIYKVCFSKKHQY